LKLPSPFILTVRAFTDRVKAFRKHLLEQASGTIDHMQG